MSRDNAIAAFEIGQMLRHVRQTSGLTQEQVAKAVGVHRTTVGDAEEGKRMQMTILLFRILDALGYSWRLRKVPRGDNSQEQGDAREQASADSKMLTSSQVIPQGEFATRMSPKDQERAAMVADAGRG